MLLVQAKCNITLIPIVASSFMLSVSKGRKVTLHRSLQTHVANVYA